jgi:LysR family cys regulon transcriptional activator
MLRDRRVDFAIVSGTQQPFPDAVALPLYRWDRVVIVPRDHELARLGRPPDLAQLAQYPLVTYLFSDQPESSLMSAFRGADLAPRIAFTARDADVIKTYVRSGFGVGVLASMAVESSDDDLAVIRAPAPLPSLTTWVVFARDLPLRRFHRDFLRLLAPHLPETVIDGLSRPPHASSGAESVGEIPYRSGDRHP